MTDMGDRSKQPIGTCRQISRCSDDHEPADLSSVMITSDADSENKAIVRVRQLASIQCGCTDECMFGPSSALSSDKRSCSKTGESNLLLHPRGSGLL